MNFDHIKLIIIYLVEEILNQLAYQLGRIVGYAANKYQVVKGLLSRFIEGVKEYVECAIQAHLLSMR